MSTPKLKSGITRDHDTVLNQIVGKGPKAFIGEEAYRVIDLLRNANRESETYECEILCLVVTIDRREPRQEIARPRTALCSDWEREYPPAACHEPRRSGEP